MDGNYYFVFLLLIWLPVILALYEQRKTQQQIRIRQIKKRRKGAIPMSEALQCFVGKRCMISLASGANFVCDVKAVDGNWLTVLTGKSGKDVVNMFNTDYITHIQEKK